MMDFLNGIQKGVAKGVVDQAMKTIAGTISKSAIYRGALQEIAAGEHGDGTCGCARRAAQALRDAEKAA